MRGRLRHLRLETYTGIPLQNHKVKASLWPDPHGQHFPMPGRDLQKDDGCTTASATVGKIVWMESFLAGKPS